MDVSKAEEKKKQSNIDCIPVFRFLLKKCVKMLLCHCFITIFTLFMKLFFERNAKYQAPEQFQQNYQDISIFFSFNSNSILLTEEWKWEKKNTISKQSISHQKVLLFLHLTAVVKSWHLCNTNCSILKTETIEIIAAGAMLGNYPITPKLLYTWNCNRHDCLT